MNKKEALYFMLASLISAETCVSEEACMESEKSLEILRESLDEFGLDEAEKKLILEKIDNGINIVRRDAEEFRNKKSEGK